MVGQSVTTKCRLALRSENTVTGDTIFSSSMDLDIKISPGTSEIQIIKTPWPEADAAGKDTCCQASALSSIPDPHVQEEN